MGASDFNRKSSYPLLIIQKSKPCPGQNHQTIWRIEYLRKSNPETV